MKLSFKKTLTVILTSLALTFSAIGVTRAHAASFTVTNLNNSGAGSLRQAISDANTNLGADTITFSVSGPIPLLSSLPSITDAAGLTIDGTGQTVTISGENAVRVLVVNAGALLTLNHLTIANGNPTIYGGGGGIYNSGTLHITNSTFSRNRATAGGIYGGGIYNNGGTATITNSTFSRNSATGGLGGGIFTSSGTLTITNSTFSGNSATTGGGVNNNAATVTLRNTIVANSPSGGNCSGAITNGGNNIDSGTTCGWGSTNGSKSSTPPLLGALTNNGGPTQTFALLTGSPAIDGVTFNAPNSAPSTDQRGVARPQGVRYDIGAFELDNTPPTVAMTSLSSNPTHASPIVVTVTFSESVTGFTSTDIVPTNGSVSSFTAVNSTTYTFDLTPTADGLVTANIAAGVATDLAGNGNTIAAQFSRTYTTVYNLFLPLILR